MHHTHIVALLLMNRYLCIHGHFYQPPRENPWIDEIEIQDSAYPYQNWNERISAECYNPNAFARILNNQKAITNIVNNYSKISFNFGPTLLSWMERYDKETYKAILEADKKSMELFNGHGSAIAQVYNHMIMPLANRQDKITQVVWGIKDFESRFKRKPEGMWLAEAAVDTETLEILADNGIRFTVLAPSQCARTRKIGDKYWQEEPNAKVDPKKPYLYKLPSGKSIVIFFYDGPISQGIAFGDTLKSGERFAARLLSAFDLRKDEQLVHIATDGETYGHHQKFADMALAYCLNYVENNNLATITIYGQYLDLFPPKYEAQINENSSWSCAHGVERWRADCGCNSGMNRGWRQQWRAPLRKALDFARDAMLETFEQKGKDYFTDVWAARNAYIDVILDNSKTEDFLKQYGTPLALQDKPAALKFMQMQKYAMFMYTSCGWFFDEISGIETVQIMAYAKRALGFNKGITGQDLQKQFIDKLSLAPSNIPNLRDGGTIYKQLVQPMSVSLPKVAINYAISYLLDEILFEDRIFFYDITEPKVEVSRQGASRLVTGYATFTSRNTLQTRKVSFAVLHKSGYDITAGAIYGQTDNLENIREVFNYGEMEECAALIKGSFVDVMDIKALLRSRQRQILANSIEKAKKRIRANFVDMFQKEHTVMGYLQHVGLPMPKLFLNLSEFVLNFELKEELQKDTPDAVRIGYILGDIKDSGAKVDAQSVERVTTKKLNILTDILVKDTMNLANVSKLSEYLGFLDSFALPVNKYRTQNLIFKQLSEAAPALKQHQLCQILCKRLNINLV